MKPIGKRIKMTVAEKHANMYDRVSPTGVLKSYFKVRTLANTISMNASMKIFSIDVKNVVFLSQFCMF